MAMTDAMVEQAGKANDTPAIHECLFFQNESSHVLNNSTTSTNQRLFTLQGGNSFVSVGGRRAISWLFNQSVIK